MLVEAKAAPTERTGARGRHHVDERRRVDQQRAIRGAARGEAREPVEITDVLPLLLAGRSSSRSHASELAHAGRFDRALGRA